MKLKLFLFAFLPIFLVTCFSLSQEKWSMDPRMTAVYPTGEYVPLPQAPDNVYNPNHEVRVVNTKDGTVLVNPNFRVHPSTTTSQTEVIIVRHPTNQAIMLGSSNAIYPLTSFSFISEGVYVTTNSGVNWFGSDTCTGAPITNHLGDPGPIIDKNGVFHMTHLGYTTYGIYAHYSTNLGATWSAQYTVISGNQDKNLACTDDAPASPYYGRSFVAWSLFTAAAPPIDISYTTNYGVSWSTPQQVNTPPSAHYSQGVEPRVGPAGQVYLVWAAPVLGSPYTEDFYGFARSSNGGVNWTVVENAWDGNGIRGNLSTKGNIRVNSFPRIDVDKTGGARNGWIYVVGCDKNLSPAGSDPDIILHRSTDGGATWSAGIRVNQDPLNNGAIQYFPAVRVDENGGVNVVYYDDRNVGSNLVEVYVSRSTDGGTTWSDILVSDHNFAPGAVPGAAGGYSGDYIGITSGNGKVWPLWMDRYQVNYNQAWTTYIELGPSISHTPLGNTENLTGPYVVNCVITPSGSAIDPSKTRLLWSRNNPSITDSLLLTNTSGNNWTGNIPGNGINNSTYRYYLKAVDMLGRVTTAPGGAPGNLYSFLAMTDTIKPVITHTPLQNIPKIQWPATVTATVTDNIGIDSVWVRWYKNNTGTGIKQFKLLNTGGNNFAAAFNSDTSQVAFNDSIYYRIIAQDNSSHHNKDSTSLYTFKIIAVANSCIGTGTTQIAYPYNTYWYGSRTNMLYTAAEILAGGGAPGVITKIGFNVYSAAAQPMNGFNIRMQNTALTSLSSTFTSSGWTTVYTGTYTVPGTGWQFVTLQNPFYWNGTSNLLIEICFGNTSYTSATNVLGSSAAGMTVEYHADVSTACSVASGSVQSTRPNICMSINLMVGNKNNERIIPQIFSLEQNYPNPFNPTTNIRYAIPKQSVVKLVVYDVVGREVTTLVNGTLQAGNYEAEFDGTNLASGVYFYRLEAGNFVDVKKMVLIK